MRVFCPNCGSENEGTPGGRLTCRACTASFEVPRADTPTGPPRPAPQPPPQPPPQQPKPAPPHQPWPGLGGNPMGTPPGLSPPTPGPSFAAPSTMPVVTNPLAIASLVMGILCCFPFAVGALITGVIARNQIASSGGQQKGGELAMVGIILGGLSILANVVLTTLSIIRGG